MGKQQKPIVPEKTQTQILAEQLSKSAIDKGLTYDPKIIEQVGAGKEGTYQGLEKVYPSLEGDFFDPYEDYIDKGTLKGGQYDIETLNKLRADNQSNWEQLGHGIGRVAYNIVPQIIGGLASMVDIQGYWDAEHAANNTIVNAVDESKKNVDQNIFPIYENNPDKSLQLNDFAWWASRGSGLVESVGSFLVQGAGAAKLTSLGLRGLSEISGGQKLARAIFGVEKSKSLLGGAETLASSMMLNQSEAVIESAQVYKDTYQDRLKLGYSNEEANTAAAAAATTTMNLNRINILLNLTSAAAFLKPLKSTRNILSAPSLAHTAFELGQEGSQEALEELVNHVAAKKGMATGQGKEYGIKEALKDMGSMEGFEAAFLGALGGVAQTAGTSLLKHSKYGPASTINAEGSRVSAVTDEKNRYSQQQEVINSLKDKGVKVTDSMKDLKETIIFQQKLNEALEKGDQTTFDNLKEDMFESQALTSFKAGTTKILENLYKQEASKNPEEVGQDHINRANKAIKNLQELEKIYNNFEDYSNVDELFFNKANKIRTDKNISSLESVQKQTELELNKSIQNISKNYLFNKEQEVLLKKEGEIQEVKKREYSVPIPYSITNLEENIGDTEENKEIYNKFLNEIKQVPTYQANNELKDQISKLQNISINLDKDFNNLTSPKHQEKVKQYQEKQDKVKEAFKKVNISSSVAELQAIKSSIDDKELHKAIDEKINELKDNSNKDLARKKTDLIVSNLTQKINNTTEEDLDSLREEINSQEISKIDKDALLDEVNKRISVLNGDSKTESETINLSDLFTSDQHAAEDVIHSEEVYKTNIPDDIPNNNTEKLQVEKETNEAIEKVSLDKSTINGTNNSDNFIYDYSRPIEGNNRAAFLSREFNQYNKVGIVNREEITNSIDNLQVLDPDSLQEGTPIYLTIKEDYEGEKYNSETKTKEKIPWKVRELELQTKYKDNYKNSEEYINEVPIVISSKEGKELFYLHDTSWINTENIDADNKQLEEDKNTLIAMRLAIIKHGTIKTKITYKSFGKLFKTINNEFLDVSKAMPDKNLVLAIGQDGVFKMSDNISKILKGGKNAKILNNNPSNGRLYAIVPIGQVENIAIPLERKLLSEESINSIIEVIKIYLDNDTENKIVKELGSPSSLNINILEIEGLKQYLSKFVHLIATEGNSGLSPFLEVKTEELNSSVPLVTITPTGIEFGRPGINDQLAGKGKKAVIISRNFQETNNESRNEIAKSENFAKLAKLKTHLSKMLSNVDKNTLQSKGKTAIIDKDGNIKTIPYTDYIKDSYQTNIQSLNIGTEEEPKWIYTIQPTILFDNSFAQKELEIVKEEKSSSERVEEKSLNKSEQESALELANTEISNYELESFLQNINSETSIPGLTINIVKKALEIRNSKNISNEDIIKVGDLEIDLDEGDSTPFGEDIDNSIPELSEEQLKQQNSEINSLLIKGLSPRTQQSLISYISSKIIQESLLAKETLGNAQININKIFSEIKDNFKKLSQLCKEKGLVNKAEKLNMIIDQFNKVQDLTQQYLSLLSTGTVSDIIQDDNASEGGLERTIFSDDWTFTVSSKTTASSDLKKFFSFIVAQNEKGPIKNSLGFPEVLPFDEVYDTLHELLANKTSDYNTLIQHLEISKNRFPWIQSVISKLETTSEKIRNEFVSDMTKHSIDMRFVMWSKDKNGAYSLQDWSSNASSIEQRLRNFWTSNLKGVNNKSNLVNINDEGVYIFNQEEVNKILSKAKEWEIIPPKFDHHEELAKWLNNFGIILSEKTYQDLANGKFNNKGRLNWVELFKNSKGLVKVLAKELEKNRENTIDEAEILNDSVIKQLAKLEASNNSNTFSNSFQAGGKTIYSYGNNNFLINRMRDLTSIDDEGNFTNSKLIEDLQKISFTQDSLWLEELTSNTEIGIATRNNLKLSYLSLEALKKKYSPTQDNRKLNKLTTGEHEVAKTAFFFNTSGDNIDGEKRRVVRFFYPTMSDKSTMLTISALSRELKLNEEGDLSEDNLNLLFDSIVLPEIKRIQAKQADDVAGYEPNYFYFIPSLNKLEIEVNNKKLNFRDLVIDKTTLSKEIKDQVILELKSIFNDLSNKKLEDWKKLGIGITDHKNQNLNSFLDKGYMANIAKGGNNEAKVKFAAMDYIYNYLIANAESYKLFAGDPALYAKFKKNKSLDENLSETFTNIGKRLAGDIAPGIELANSIGNKYYQVFLSDKKLNSNNVNDSIQLEYFSKIMSDFKKNYSDIEGSDAQEYTTWKEHLYVMKQLGRLTEKQFNEFTTKLNSNKELTYNELGTILQPLKPVYVGNITSIQNNIDRRIYIKSSSFPLIPQLTSGLEIDKIRKSLEKFENSKSTESSNGQSSTVRASFGTANKVGSVKDTLNIFDDKGNVLDNLEISDSNTLLLSRENFRIQQDVPYKREKEEINIGTQERKLLFVNLLDLEIEKGLSGEQLQNSYNENYSELFEYAQDKLFKKLGIREEIEQEKDLSSLFTIPESNIFEQLENNEEINLEPEELERINFINNNFDSIVEKLVKNAKINVFFEDENNQFKKCD